MSIFFDSNGLVIATADLPCRSPWDIRESSKFAGRYYFFNAETNRSEWSLHPWQLGLESASPANAEAKLNEGDATKDGGGAKQEGRAPGGGFCGKRSAQSTGNLPSLALPSINSPSGSNGRGGSGGRASPLHDNARMSPALAPSPTGSSSSSSSGGGGGGNSWGMAPIRHILGVKPKALMGGSSSTNNLSALNDSTNNGGGSNASGSGSLARGGSQVFGSILGGTKSGRQGLRTSNHGVLSSMAAKLPGGNGGGMTSPTGSQDPNSFDASALDGGRFGTVLSGGAASLVVKSGLGQGGYAVVVKVQHQPSGQDFAMKVVAKEKVSRRRDRQRLKLEIRVMTELPPSPFLQRCYMAFESDSQLFFVLDLVGGGDLFYHLVQKISENGWGFPEDQARVLLAEVVAGLEHMHAHGLIHRDIKVENIMLDARGHVKLIDFGLAVEIHSDEEPVSPTGSLIYMAPEMIRDHSGGRHTDWWALGVLSYELLTGRTPWSSLTDKKVIRKEIQNMIVTPPRKLSPPAGMFVCSLLKQDYKTRLGTKADKEVRGARFFNAIDWSALELQTSAPAFKLPSECVTERDARAALEAYLSRRVGARGSSGGSGEAKGGDGKESEDKGPWYLGLDQVDAHPLYSQ